MTDIELKHLIRMQIEIAKALALLMQDRGSPRNAKEIMDQARHTSFVILGERI